MNYKGKSFLIFIISIILSYIIAPYSGKLYERIIGYNVTSWGGYNAERYEGFLLAFAFFTACLFFGFLKQKRVNIAIVFTLIPALLLLLARQGDAFLISLGFSIIGFGLGQLIYLTRKAIFKKKKTD